MKSGSWVPFRRIDRDDAEQSRRLLLNRHALLLHILRQLRKRHLNAVVHVDGVDVGVGAKLERDGQRVAAIVAADALHVDRFIDADDLSLDRLGYRCIDNGGGGAGIIRRDRHLRRYDIRILRDGNDKKGDRACDCGDDRYDDREPRAVDEEWRRARPSSLLQAWARR